MFISNFSIKYLSFDFIYLVAKFASNGFATMTRINHLLTFQEYSSTNKKLTDAVFIITSNVVFNIKDTKLLHTMDVRLFRLFYEYYS